MTLISFLNIFWAHCTLDQFTPSEFPHLNKTENNIVHYIINREWFQSQPYFHISQCLMKMFHIYEVQLNLNSLLTFSQINLSLVNQNRVWNVSALGFGFRVCVCVCWRFVYMFKICICDRALLAAVSWPGYWMFRFPNCTSILYCFFANILWLSSDDLILPGSCIWLLPSEVWSGPTPAPAPWSGPSGTPSPGSPALPLWDLWCSHLGLLQPSDGPPLVLLLESPDMRRTVHLILQCVDNKSKPSSRSAKAESESDRQNIR